MEMSASGAAGVLPRGLVEAAKGAAKTVGRYVLRQSHKYQTTYVRSREYFPYILNAKGLLGEGVEIGTQHGYYSEVILSTWKGSRLYSIDPWMQFDRDSYLDIANVSEEGHEQCYQQTVSRLKQFGSRSCILRKTSKEAAIEIKEGQLDFVYIDAQHHYEAVKEDIELWHPKIRKGGVLAGHDYLDGNVDAGIFGVKSAVDEFVGKTKAKLTISKEAEWRSWFIFV